MSTKSVTVEVKCCMNCPHMEWRNDTNPSCSFTGYNVAKHGHGRGFRPDCPKVRGGTLLYVWR